MSFLRLAARVAGLVALAVALVPLHYLWRLAGRASPWPRWFLGMAAWIAGARVRVEGAPRADRVLVVANHQSWLDILILGGACGCAFVAKAELAEAPLVGWLAGLNRTIYVRREDRRGIGGQIAAIRDGLATGPVAVFPEGTTGDGIRLLPFKPALMQVLDPSPPGVRVQPVFVDYGAAAPGIAWTDEDGMTNVRRVLGRRGTLPVTVHCLPPFDPADVGDRKAIAAEAHRRIVDAIAASGSAITA